MSDKTDQVGKPWFPADFGEWISLAEAQARSLGQVAWWLSPTEEEEEDSHHVLPEKPRCDSPDDRPVFLMRSNHMYWGQWESDEEAKQHMWHGWGVYYRHDGQVFRGEWFYGKLSGLAQRLWIPESEAWKSNAKASSVIRRREDKQTGLPFLYLGSYWENWKHDPCATVILKDGTTRVGPWRRNKPVGDWWQDHLIIRSSYKVDQLIQFRRLDDLPLVVKEEEELEIAPSSSLSDDSAAPIAAQHGTPRKHLSTISGPYVSTAIHMPSTKVAKPPAFASLAVN